MKLIEEKYRRLQPTIKYLVDEVVMAQAQAWEKVHGVPGRSALLYLPRALTVRQNRKYD